MEPGRGSPAERLIAELNRLRRDAGNPSLSELARLSERKLPRSTLHDHLTGQRSGLPPWRLVAAYVSACHAAASETGLDVERLGTLEQWQARYAAAVDDENVAGQIGESNSVRLGTAPYHVREDATKPPSQHVTRGLPTSGTQSETVASSSVAPVIQRLEEDLSRLGNSLDSNTGLLVVTSGPTVGTRFLIEHHITTIGRSPESDIWLNDPTVSRHHAAIYRRGDRFFIRDAGSQNGTVLRQRLVEAESPLSSYEEVGIAVFSLMFLQGGDSARRSQKSYKPVRSRLIKDTSASTEQFRPFAQRVDESQPYGRPKGRGTWGRLRRRSQQPPK
jgi:pSer/pThr/pTyr-binding forkhead associated (FHA) protein